MLVVCNALDDVTRQHRQITTDSPAASRKIFLLCEALRLAGVRPYVVSLGRGRAGGTASYYSSAICRVNRVPVFYAPFVTVPIISELVSLFGLLGFVYKVRKLNPKAAVYYNRLAAYIPTLIATSFLGFINILDLEDGEVSTVSSATKLSYSNWLKRLFDKLCGGGALLACSALETFTSARPVLCYYGTAVGDISSSRWKSESISILMGGSLSVDTGAQLLIESIRLLRQKKSSLTELLCFEITGGGPCLDNFKLLAAEDGFPKVVVHGRVTDDQYQNILKRCSVGLALKLNSGPLAHTTFPSKVVELAAAGLLVLTTDISDVRKVLGDGALYLERDDPQRLAELLGQLVLRRSDVERCALLGMHKVHADCAPISSGNMVADFIFLHQR